MEDAFQTFAIMFCEVAVCGVVQIPKQSKMSTRALEHAILLVTIVGSITELDCSAWRFSRIRSQSQSLRTAAAPWGRPAAGSHSRSVFGATGRRRRWRGSSVAAGTKHIFVGASEPAALFYSQREGCARPVMRSVPVVVL